MRPRHIRTAPAKTALAFAILLPTFAAATEKTPADASYQLEGCSVTLYKNKNATGESWTTNAGWADLGDQWNGKVASLKVEKGTWRFFAHPSYQGDQEDLAAPDQKDLTAGEMSNAASRKITTIGSFICIQKP